MFAGILSAFSTDPQNESRQPNSKPKPIGKRRSSPSERKDTAWKLSLNEPACRNMVSTKFSISGNICQHVDNILIHIRKFLTDDVASTYI